MATDTPVNTLIINKLTEAQYKSATRSPTEVYFTTDSPKPLTTVAHDDTLTGAGTIESPLSVVSGGGSGGLSAVSHDATLAGSGTDADPLKVADNTYLPLSGGKLTGAVESNSVIKAAGFSFAPGDSRIGLLDDGLLATSLEFSPGGLITCHGGIVPESGSMFPISSLGLQWQPWSVVYTLKLNNGADLAVPTTGGTLARLEDIPAPELPAQEGNAGKFLTTNGTAVSWAEVQSGGSADNNGVAGDYHTHFGIIDSPNGLPTRGTGNTIDIPAGLVLSIPGSDSYVTLGSAETYTPTSTVDCTMFYARETDGTNAMYIEATDVHYSVTEPPLDGVTGFQAWYSPEYGKWRLRSNDTGNVWRDIVGGPICDLKFLDGNLVRIDFIGYRILNTQEFATKAEVGNIATVLDAINGEAI